MAVKKEVDFETETRSYLSVSSTGMIVTSKRMHHKTSEKLEAYLSPMRKVVDVDMGIGRIRYKPITFVDIRTIIVYRWKLFGLTMWKRREYDEWRKPL